MNQYFKRSTLAVALLLGLNIAILPSISSAATTLNLGAASSFGVLGSSTVTNTGSSVISGTAGGSVGSPGAITGFPPGTATGPIVTPAPAGDLTAASNAYIAGQLQPTTSIGANLGGLVLGAGAYSVPVLAGLTGTLTLNGAGNPNSVFIFDTASSLTTAGSSVIALTGGAQACNVFWLVGSSATLGTSSTFVGHIIAQTSVTATTLASVNGSLTALTGAVTLDSNAITNNNCAAVVPVPVTAPAQTSRVDSVTPAACVTTGPTTVTLNGVFPTAISNITVNGAVLPTTDWVQTPTSIVVTSPVQTSAAVIIQLYNGAVPLLAVQSFVCEPTGAVTPIVPVVIPSVPTITTGTIHVVKVVNNGYGGTAGPADFTLSLRHWGVDVVGSPAAGVGGVGRTYILAPGTYVVGEPDTAGYIHSFDINGQASQNIVLAAGESITVTQTNTQLPPLGTVTPTTPPVPTVNGGPLPKTASPWSNLLLFGLGAMVLGGVMFGRKRSTQK